MMGEQDRVPGGGQERRARTIALSGCAGSVGAGRGGVDGNDGEILDARGGCCVTVVRWNPIPRDPGDGEKVRRGGGGRVGGWADDEDGDGNERRRG
jgi:hypothetical protein